MKALIERGKRAARGAQQRHIDELASEIAQRLPRAEVERDAAGVSVCGRRLLEQWLGNADLRFLGNKAR